MKVIIKKVTSAEEEEAVIKTMQVTDSIGSAISLLENGEKTLMCVKDGESIPCLFSAIYYIETIEDKTFVYTKNECLENKSRLYELESNLDFRFFRCSKSMILNVKKIKSVKAVDNAKMEATLLNDEKVVITRSYVKTLKKRLGL